MKIAAANLQFSSTHTSERQHTIRESLHAWVGQRRPAAGAEASRPLPAETVALSSAGQTASAEATHTDAADELDDDPRVTLIRLMLEHLTGRRVKVFDAGDLQGDGQGSAASATTSATPSRPPSSGFGVEYERHESYSESEQTSFAASGSVVTADGRRIDFSLQLAMSRSYREESHISLRLGDAARPTDPLVLNFAGSAAQLSDQRFAFDLNADGQAEQINRLAAGSGFLVFDRNGDRQVKDGGELFGPASNDGFAELAALDDDGNGWIDENDAAFSRLGVWTPDDSGHNVMNPLSSAGVGALSLSQIDTPFAIKNNANQLLGQIRSSGIFLQESGAAGTMQQIDLTA